ncbi:MAG: Dabb family protein [Planctomycetota bacterium]
MPRLAHHVFFTLKDRSPAAQDTLVAACKKYLDEHPGLIDFSVGRRDPELDRPVNGDFDVSLHCIFDSRASHDVYQAAPRHMAFIEETQATWAEVRVFDSILEG